MFDSSMTFGFFENDQKLLVLCLKQEYPKGVKQVFQKSFLDITLFQTSLDSSRLPIWNQHKIYTRFDTHHDIFARQKFL